MDLLMGIREHGKRRGLQAAVCSEGEEICYEQLDQASDRLAAFIDDVCGSDRGPVVVYGHKSAWMAVCFLACMKSGRAYCPLDVSLPAARISDVLELSGAAMVLEPELETPPLRSFLPDAARKQGSRRRYFAGAHEIRATAATYMRRIEECKAIGPEETCYIIFTSGSTGMPKGVQVTRGNLEHFLSWAMELGMDSEKKAGLVFLNQAPFSFDLSVMDLYCALSCGGTLRTMERAVQEDYFKLMDFLKRSETAIWVSTPSFVEMCLADPQFSEKRLEQLRLFLFCGETLSAMTARKLRERFSQAKVINTYGPTESTVAVTAVEITEELLSQCEKAQSALPVGRMKPGTVVEICREDGSMAGASEQGEIIIWGDTVAAGYFRNPERTKRTFCFRVQDGERVRGYRTGDLGTLQDGLLYFHGRTDQQIKLHGYRIELGDIEANLMQIEGVKRAAVMPNWKDGRIKSLTAYVEGGREDLDERKAAQRLKERLKKRLPEYMVPKKICFVDRIPVNENGKMDRNALGEGR